MFTLGLGLTTPYSSCLLVWKFNQTFVIASIEFWMRFKPEIRPTRLSINFLFITATVERKVRFFVKLFDFFPRWILIRWTWNVSRFVPNSVQILTCNFKKKLFPIHFSKTLWKTNAILLEKFMKFRPIFSNFFLGPYCVENFQKKLRKYFHMLFAPF